MPETVPTVPSGMPAATPDERARYAISLAPRANDPYGIGRARLACAREVARNRDILEVLARKMLTPETIADMAGAVGRLDGLMVRIDQLDAMAKALEPEPAQGPDCYECETTGRNCLAHR